MANWTFDSDAQSWTGLNWDSDDGSPAIGCLSSEDGSEVNNAGPARTGLSFGIQIGDPVSFRIRITSSGALGENDGDVAAVFQALGGVTTLATCSTSFELRIGNYPFDSGWKKVTGTATAAGTVDTVRVDVTSSNEDITWHVFIDSVYTAESEPSDNARFYHSLSGAALQEKFTLPFVGVEPGAMTLNRSLGEVVMGSNAPAGQMAVYSVYPYATGVFTGEGLPTGMAITSLKWI